MLLPSIAKRYATRLLKLPYAVPVISMAEDDSFDSDVPSVPIEKVRLQSVSECAKENGRKIR